MPGIFFSLKRKSKEKTRAQTLVTESSSLKYIFYQLHCIMVTFYHRRNRSEFRRLSPGSRLFWGLQLWLYGFVVANLWKINLSSTAGAFQLNHINWHFYVHHSSPTVLDFYFVLLFFDQLHLETWITYWS